MIGFQIVGLNSEALIYSLDDVWMILVDQFRKFDRRPERSNGFLVEVPGTIKAQFRWKVMRRIQQVQAVAQLIFPGHPPIRIIAKDDDRFQATVGHFCELADILPLFLCPQETKGLCRDQDGFRGVVARRLVVPV